MNRLIKSIKSIPFQIKWLFMSAEERYAHLWGITRKSHDLGTGIYSVIAPAQCRR